MPLNSYIIKNSSKETIIKVDGAGDTVDIALTSLVSTDQVLGASGATGYAPPAVTITAVSSSGLVNSSMTIRRGATGATGHLVVAASPENAPTLQFNQQGFVENSQTTAPIQVAHGGATGAIVTTWVTVRKVDGFYSKVEYTAYGAYDDETKVGALDIIGSPDYTG
jgi:hypothetical protein